MRVRAALALKDNSLRIGHAGPPVTCPRWLKSISAGEQGSRLFQVLGCIHAEDGVLRQRHVDAHAGFERAQLLEPLALLEWRGRQRDEALERGAAIRIEADVMIERSV